MLENDDEELFTTQLLSDMTKLEFKERELDPRLAFQEIKRRTKDVEALFDACHRVNSARGSTSQMLAKGRSRSDIRASRLACSRGMALTWSLKTMRGGYAVYHRRGQIAGELV